MELSLWHSSLFLLELQLFYGQHYMDFFDYYVILILIFWPSIDSLLFNYAYIYLELSPRTWGFHIVMNYYYYYSSGLLTYLLCPHACLHAWTS